MKRLLGVIALSLAAFLALAYRQVLTLTFVNDDYVFLDKVRHATFVELWTSNWNFFGWWRPLSREVHYWTLHAIAGLQAPAYHLASFTLWILALLLYAALVFRLAGAPTAAIATACVAALALWGAPLVWAAGAQDLWMLVFALAYLLAIARGTTWAAAGALLAALLSKETAGVLPLIGLAYLTIVERHSPKRVLTETATSWIILVAWLAIHPTLHERMFGTLHHSMETQLRPALPDIARKTALALVNLDVRPRPDRALAPVVATGLFGGLLLAIPLLFVWRRDRPAAESGRSTPRGRIAAFGFAWGALAAIVLFAPSISWHAYYGSLATLGFWLAVATILTASRPLALAVIVGLALLREARAATPSTDWGTYWYQARAGRVLVHVRAELMRMHPVLPKGSRLFFMLVPTDIGMLGGDAPAIRVWYDDPSLRAGFISAYRARSDADSVGRDFFFRFAEETEFVEVHTGPETPSTVFSNPRWKQDHDILASTFIRSGNTRGAAEEYAKLFAFDRGRWRTAVYSAAAFESIGDTARADSMYRLASRRIGMHEGLLRKRARQVVRQASDFRRTAQYSTP